MKRPQLCIIALLLPVTSLFAFNPNNYRPTTLSRIIQRYEEARDKNDTKLSNMFEMQQTGYKLITVYSGEFRDITEKHSKLLGKWLKASGSQYRIEEYAEEVKVSDGINTCWIPIDEQLATDLRKTTKDATVLYYVKYCVTDFTGKQPEHVLVIDAYED